MANRAAGRASVLAWSALLCLSVVPGAVSQEVTLAVDFDATAAPTGSRIGGWVPVGDGMLFFKVSPDQRSQLWFTNGTGAGTRLLLEGVRLAAPAASTAFPQEPRGVALSDGTALVAFAGLSDRGTGLELWRTDGTSEGTHLVTDLCPGPCDGFVGLNGRNRDFQQRGGKVFFLARPSAEVSHVYSFDPQDGLQQVSGLLASGFALTSASLPSGPGGGVPPGPAILILGRDSPESATSLWIFRESISQEQNVEAVAGATVLSMQPFRTGALAVLGLPGEANLGLYFVGEQGLDLLISGVFFATPELTHKLLGAAASSSFAFTYQQGIDTCQGLRTDGTAGGTSSFVQFSTLECWREAEMMGDRLVFVEPTGVGGGKVYASNSPATAAIVLAPNAVSEVPNGITVLDGKVLWLDEVNGQGILLSSNGTTLVQTVRTFDAVATGLPPGQPLGVLNGELLFPADAGGTGLELWKSDGTTQGTALIKNLTPDVGSSRPQELLASEQGLVFLTGDSLDPFGASSQLWLLEDGSSQPSALAEDRLPLGAINGKLIASSAPEPSLTGTIVAVDLGTGVQETLFEGAVGFVSKISSGLIVQTVRVFEGSRLFDGLWFTDGTPAGTLQLLPPASTNEFQTLSEKGISTGREVFFLLPVGNSSGSRVWRTNGTTAGTLPMHAVDGVTKILGFSGGVVYTSLVHNERTQLAAFDASSGVLLAPDRPSQRVELDRTPFGFEVAELRGRVLWFASPAANELSTPLPFKLWISDASAAGTVQLGAFTTITAPLVANRGLVFFGAGTAEQGLELWVTNGTVAGTRSLGDVAPGILGSELSMRRAVDGLLGFSLSSRTLGYELWLSDGTPTGTEVIEIEPGKSGSGPAEITASGTRVLLTANRSDVGRELFSLDRLAVRRPCVASATTVCLGEGRFALEVEWLDRVSGDRGVGGALPLRADTGSFWFFDQDNVELVVKVLDARSFSDHWWVFLGALSDVSYWLTVVDTWSGETRTYTNQQGDICGVNDTAAFPGLPEIDNLGADSPAVGSLGFSPYTGAVQLGMPAAGTQNCGGDVLCLGSERFEIRVDFSVVGEPQAGVGKAVPGTDETGYFWFFDEQNIEIAIKVIDGVSINGNWWLFYGGLSDLEYTITATDTVTGVTMQYHNEPGSICGVADIGAFPEAISE